MKRSQLLVLALVAIVVVILAVLFVTIGTTHNTTTLPVGTSSVSLIDRPPVTSTTTTTSATTSSPTATSTPTLATGAINATRILAEWQTYDDQSYSVYDDKYAATYYAPDGSLWVVVYQPFAQSRESFQNMLQSVTGQTMHELCSANIHVSIEEGDLYVTHPEVGLSGCPNDTL